MEGCPEELVVSIFKLVVGCAAARERSPQANAQALKIRLKQAVTLSHISGYLRRIAINEPKLWNEIFHAMHPEALEAATVRGTRAGLHLHLEYDTFSSIQVYEAQCLKCLAKVAPQVLSWHTILVDVASHALLQVLNKSCTWSPI